MKLISFLTTTTVTTANTMTNMNSSALLTCSIIEGAIGSCLNLDSMPLITTNTLKINVNFGKDPTMHQYT